MFFLLFRHSKFRIVYENQRPITGLGFRISGKSIILFVVTETNIISINISSKDYRVRIYFILGKTSIHICIPNLKL